MTHLKLNGIGNYRLLPRITLLIPTFTLPNFYQDYLLLLIEYLNHDERHSKNIFESYNHTSERLPSLFTINDRVPKCCWTP